MMWRTIGAAATLAGLFMTVVGCGNDSGSSTSTDPNDAGSTPAPDDDTADEDTFPRVEDLPELAAAAQCNAFEECFRPIADAFLRGADCNTFFERVAEDEDFNELRRAVEEGRVEYHGEFVEPCIEALTGRVCTDSNPESDACDNVFSGTVPLGGECSIREECEGERTCVLGDGCPGTCQTLRLPGESCREDEDCEPGLVCSEETELCVAPAGEGEACEGGVEPECSAGLFCVGQDEDEGTPGQCRPLDDVFVGEVGDACDFAAGTFCAEGLSCLFVFDAENNAAPECAERVASGEPCTIGFPAQCPSDHYCDADVDAGEFEGTCDPLPGPGEDCVIQFDEPVCAPLTVCGPDNTCIAMNRLGEPCTIDEACYSGRCDSGACVSKALCPNDG